jgi:hypothetical protein
MEHGLALDLGYTNPGRAVLPDLRPFMIALLFALSFGRVREV